MKGTKENKHDKRMRLMREIDEGMKLHVRPILKRKEK